MLNRCSAVVVLLLVSGIVVGQSVPTEPAGIECFMVLVGKEATADGSVMAAHNLELTGSEKPLVQLIPRRAASPDGMLRLSRRLEVPHRDATPAWMVLRIARSLGSNAAGMNEHGVALAGGVNLMQDRSAAIRRADPLIPTGVDGFARNAALVRSKTAREAAACLGDLYSKHGCAYACGVAYADASEIWYVESAGGTTWAAVRIPDDACWPQGNSFRIGVIDPADEENVMASAGLLEFAKARDLWDPQDGPFDFRAAFGNGVRHRVSECRVWRALTTLAPSTELDSGADSHPMFLRPDRRITLGDLFAVLRDRYDDGHENNPTGRVAEFPIGSSKIVHTDVIQLRSGMPVEVGAVMWTGLRSSPATVYVPLYMGVDAIPAAYRVTGDGSASSLFARLANSIDDMPRRAADQLLVELRALERETIEGRAAAEKRFLAVLGKDRVAARRAMTADAREICGTALRVARAALDRASSRSKPGARSGN